MALVLFLSGIYLALVTGAAGEFLMLVTSFAGLGAVVGSVLSLLAERRARRANLSPWNPPREVPVQRYMRIATASGAAIGLILAMLDAFVLA